MLQCWNWQTGYVESVVSNGHVGSTPTCNTKYINAHVAELADAPASSPGAARRGGATPSMSTNLPAIPNGAGAISYVV